MSDKPLRVALVGAGAFGANALKGLCRTTQVVLAGLSDQVPAVAEAAAAQAGCPAYTDHRRLLAETKPEALFLAVPPFAVSELVGLAVQHGCHIWVGAPFARGLNEGVALCRQADQAGRKLAIGAPRRFMSGYAWARERLKDIGKIYLARVHYLFNWGPTLGWRGDSAAGGGVLLEQGCHMFDLATWMLGLPQTVFCQAGTGQRPASKDVQPVYDTEDTAVSVLSYPAKSVVTVTLSRCFNPVDEGLVLYGQGGSLSAGPSGCVHRDREGAIVEAFQDDQPLPGVFARQIEGFAAQIARGRPEYDNSAWEHLLPLAVIEAARLSNRTGQPEAPEALLSNFRLTAEDCLKVRQGLPPPK